MSGCISLPFLNIFFHAAAPLSAKWVLVLLMWIQCIATSTSTELNTAATTETEAYTGTTPEPPPEPHHIIYDRLRTHTEILQRHHHATYTQFVSISTVDFLIIFHL